jgi:hypothetical protein
VLTGCAHQPAQQARQAPRVPQVTPAIFYSPGIERSLQYWTANFSLQATNHFHVWATEMDRGDLVEALVYWREGGRLLDYAEVPKGAEAQAWRLRPKVDRDALLTDEQISHGNDLVPHGVWMHCVKQCITNGKEYVVTLQEAQAYYPRPKDPISPRP